ncbi:superinfection immunity protein [Leptospira idonii]|uniref:Superinfection immunity protein n=1 Tax=Leptospira idonii TaxID=1193500 RepID=A0A4R9M0M8_9LEPT|nr:superinfection immunity protein [Leptospira idonii]TGN20223.1 superinfection immunity protein [Leptospira idonii]
MNQFALKNIGIWEIVIPGLLFCAFICLYFLPTIISIFKKSNMLKVFLTNLFLGWTFLGWIYSLIISIKKQKISNSL